MTHTDVMTLANDEEKTAGDAFQMLIEQHVRRHPIAVGKNLIVNLNS